MTAGKAVCNCDQPDTCLCMVKVEADEKTYIYQQRGRLPNICIQDEEGEGVDVKVLITPKGCVSGLSDCPSGFIHHIEKKEVEYKLTHSKEETCKLKYLDPVTTETQLASKYNIVAIIGMLINDMVNGIDYTKYRMVVDECKDQEKKTSDFSFEQVLLLLGIANTVNYITVYPKYEFKLGVVIGTETAVAKLDANARRGIMRQYNRNFKQRDTHKGWTKRTNANSITRSITISGFSEYNVGKLTVKAETDQLKKEFIEYKNKLSILNQAESVVSTVENLFSASAQGTSHRVFDAEILLPTAIIAGGVELAINKTLNKPMMRGKVDLSLEPLLGVKFKVDLIQAFATAYNLQYIVGNIREAAASGKEAVEQGRSGAYLEGTFDLVVEGAIDVGLSFFYDKESKFDFKLLDDTEGKLSIGGEAEIEAGGKVLRVKGYFVAGGSIKAEGCCGLQTRKAANANEKNGLDLIFYHNGIEAKFWADAGFGRRSEVEQSNSTTVNGNGTVTGQSKTSTQQDEDGDKLLEHTWQISEKLKKEDSTYKVSIL